MGKNTSTTTQTSGNPAAMSAYYNLLPQIQAAGSTPYQAFGGQLVAPTNEQQATGIAGINSNAYGAIPYLQQAGGMLTSAGQPLTPEQVQQYYSPYQQQVVQATENQFANTNAQQQQQVLGNAASQGALGGDRTAVAQAVLAGQQQAQEAPTIAGLENTGYNQAVQYAQQQFQQNPEAVAYGLGSTGTSLENAGLTGANAQVGAGTLEQQTQQAQDTAAYQQYMQALAYPFQTLGWETGELTGLGGAMGGTSTTTPPPPNPYTQAAGLGIAALGAIANRGGRIQKLAGGGAPSTPFGGDGFPSWVPTAGAITPLNIKAPAAPKTPTTQAAGTNVAGIPGLTPASMGKAFSGGENLLGKALPDSPSYGGGNAFTGDAFGGSAANPLPGLTAADYGTDAVASGAGDTAGLAADAAATGDVAAAGAGASSIADLLPMLALANRGGRIARAYGGLALPKQNRIQLRRGGVPVRAGLGLASFVPRKGYDSGGAPTADDDDLSANSYIAQNFPQTLPGLGGAPVDASDPDNSIYSPVAAGRDPKYALANLTDTGLVPTDSPPPQQQGLGTTTLAFDNEQPTGGLQTPPPAPQQAPPAATDDSPADHIKRPQGVTFGFNSISPEAKYGLIAAGLGMMASRSPYAGVAVGEGGLQGLQSYTGLKKDEQNVDLAVAKLKQEAKQHQDQIALETKKENDPYTKMTAAQIAENEFRNREAQRQEQQPVKVGTDMSTGTDIYAVRDPSVPGGFRRIDPTQLGGHVTPMGTGAPVAPMTPAPAGPSVPTSQQQLPGTSSPTAGDMPPGIRPEVLGALEPNMAAQIKALDEGRMAFPTGFALSKPYWQNMLRLVSQYDPSFDAVNYNARAKTRADFVAGKSAQNITSFNTAIGHLDSLDKAIEPLGNTRFGWLNPMLQAGKSATGDTQFQAAQKDFMAKRQAVTDELTRAFRGSGGNVHDIVGWEQTLNSADSPQALHAAVKSAVDLLKSRIEAVGDTYNRGMGTTRSPLTLLSPHAQEAITRLGGSTGDSALIEARAAIQAGAPRDAVIQRLRANGVDPSGL
jgi:hypothetical protein